MHFSLFCITVQRYDIFFLQIPNYLPFIFSKNAFIGKKGYSLTTYSLRTFRFFSMDKTYIIKFNININIFLSIYLVRKNVNIKSG